MHSAPSNAPLNQQQAFLKFHYLAAAVLFIASLIVNFNAPIEITNKLDWRFYISLLYLLLFPVLFVSSLISFYFSRVGGIIGMISLFVSACILCK